MVGNCCWKQHTVYFYLVSVNTLGVVGCDQHVWWSRNFPPVKATSSVFLLVVSKTTTNILTHINMATTNTVITKGICVHVFIPIFLQIIPFVTWPCFLSQLGWEQLSSPDCHCLDDLHINCTDWLQAKPNWFPVRRESPVDLFALRQLWESRMRSWSAGFISAHWAALIASLKVVLMKTWLVTEG